MKNKLTVAVLGAGAIGGITAAYLKRAGYDVTLVCKHEQKAEQIKTKGLHIVGVRGEHYVKMNAVAKAEQLSGKKDLVLIVTKAYDMPDAANSIMGFLKEDSLVVSMQNGICVEALADIVGDNRAVGCVVGWGSTMLEDGTLNMTSEGDFVIGGFLPNLDVSAIKQALDNVVPVRISDNIIADLYSKMIVNACITSLGVLSGLNLGKILKKRAARNIFISIIREAVQVADAMGLRIKPFGGKLDYYKLTRGSGSLAGIKRHALIRIIGFKYRRLKSSSLQALERGKPTEVDYFNGYIAAKGEQYGISTPVNARIVQMIKEIENKKRAIGVSNIFDGELLRR